MTPEEKARKIIDGSDYLFKMHPLNGLPIDYLRLLHTAIDNVKRGTIDVTNRKGGINLSLYDLQGR